MAAGFFKAVTLTAAAPPSLVAKCGACGLFKNCQSPKMPVSGRGRRKILIVGEAPGKNEDREGKPFVGISGQKLSAAFDRAGIDLRKDCWLTNAIICRPAGNAKPTANQIAHCRPNLTRAIRELNPEVIIPVGEAAVKAVLTGLWREDIGTIGRWVGWKIPCRDLDAWICPIWHPIYLLRQEDPALEIWFQRYVNRIAKIEGRPWGAAKPDLTKKIEVITNPKKAARRIRGILLLGDLPSTFDLETNCKNPDHPKAEIVCCSICFEGHTTIAFPWAGAAIDAMAEYLRSRGPKRGANIKFEERWILAKLGFPVKNWVWDCMQAAHIADNRRGITSVKFQFFIREGFSVYDEAIKPYLQEADAEGFNRIGEVDLRKLLIYCGIDSYAEYQIAESQMKELGYELH